YRSQRHARPAVEEEVAADHGEAAAAPDHAAKVIFNLLRRAGCDGDPDVVALPDFLPRPKRWRLQRERLCRSGFLWRLIIVSSASRRPHGALVPARRPLSQSRSWFRPSREQPSCARTSLSGTAYPSLRANASSGPRRTGYPLYRGMSSFLVCPIDKDNPYGIYIYKSYGKKSSGLAVRDRR